MIFLPCFLFWKFTYGFWVLFHLLRLQKLSFFLVVTPGCDTGDDSYGEKNGCTLDPCVGSLLRFGKTHVNDDGENSTNDEDLQHEVIEGSKEELTEWCSLWAFFVIGSEHLFSNLEGLGCGAWIKCDIKGFLKSHGTIKFVLQVGNVFNVCSCSVCFNKINKLLLINLELRTVGGSDRIILQLNSLTTWVCSLCWHFIDFSFLNFQ